MFLIIISIIGNYIYFQSKQLDEPLFINHYISREILEQDEVKLYFYYLTNKENPVKINYLEVGGIEAYPENYHFNMLNNSQHPIHFVEEYNHHYLVQARITFRTDMLPMEDNRLWSFEKMIVHLSNGEMTNVDIGKVIIGNLNREYHRGFEHRSSISNSSNYLDKDVLEATEALTVEDIHVPFANKVMQDVAIKINSNQESLNKQSEGEEKLPEWLKNDMKENWKRLPGVELNESLLPISINKGEWVHFIKQYNPRKHSYYDFNIKIKGSLDSEENFIYPIRVNDWPDFEQDDINEIIAEKESREMP